MRAVNRSASQTTMSCTEVTVPVINIVVNPTPLPAIIEPPSSVLVGNFKKRVAEYLDKNWTIVEDFLDRLMKEKGIQGINIRWKERHLFGKNKYMIEVSFPEIEMFPGFKANKICVVGQVKKKFVVKYSMVGNDQLFVNLTPNFEDDHGAHRLILHMVMVQKGLIHNDVSLLLNLYDYAVIVKDLSGNETCFEPQIVFTGSRAILKVHTFQVYYENGVAWVNLHDCFSSHDDGRRVFENYMVKFCRHHC
jgi:hypothetical protein